MAIEVTRKSRMAIKEETAGIPVAPVAGSDYLAVQDGLSLTPNFEVLESAELKASIGASKPIVADSSPEGSLAHYVYHSGTEGALPEMHLLLKGAFGDHSLAATEYTVVSATAGSASAAATITVGAGLGAQFEVGEALLIKLPSGFVIRSIKSIAGDVLTLNFNLSNITGIAGVGLGKCVLYKPADELPSLSIWDYRGNGAAVQMMSGSKVSEMSISAEAGAFINAEFSLTGSEFYFNPIELTSSSNKIEFTTDTGSLSAELTAKFYIDPFDAAAALAQAMTSADGSETISVSYSNSTGKFTAASTGAVFSVDWATSTDSLGAKFGFTADDTGALSYVSDVAIGIESPQTPVLSGQDPLVAKNNSVLLGGFADNVCFPANSITMSLSNEISEVKIICSDKIKTPQGRAVTVEIAAVLDKYRSEEFKRFRTNEETSFQYAFGPKSGNSFVAGKSGAIYLPKATITSFELSDLEGVVSIAITLTAYTQSGEGEIYLGLV
jgi:hypothetical protein